MNHQSHFTQARLLARIIWAYAIYLCLVLLAFGIGYFLLPRGALLHTPWAALGAFANMQQSALAQFIATIGFNLGFVLVLGVGLNLQRVREFPTGYIFIFSAGIVSGLFAGTNSFTSQNISPYSWEGWIVAIRIQHLELLGYTVIVASTITVGLRDYSSWLPWKAKETRIQRWRDIHFTPQEKLGVIIGIAFLLLASYNETVLTI